MKKRSLLICLVIFSYSIYAQRESGDTLRPVRIKGAYLGNVIYPGFKIGVEYPIKTVEKIKTRKQLQSSRKKDRFISLSYGMYHQKTIHTNHWITAEWCGRLTKAGGFFTDSNMGFGLNRTFINGTTYEVDDAGKVSKDRGAGYYYAHLTVGLGLGYDFKIKDPDRPYSVFARTNLMIMFPYNSFIYPRPSVEIGGAYILKNVYAKRITKRK